MNTLTKISTIVLVFIFAATGFAEAELEWETDHVSINAEMGQDKVVAKYPFTVLGEQAVKISQVRASCGCTATKLDKDTYEPGESSEIEAVFTIGNRQGKQVKKIFVHLNDATSPTYTLTLEVDIPELLKIEPRFVYWGVNDELESKIIKLSVPHEEKVLVRQVRCMNNQIKVDLKTIEDGKEYEVIITPMDLKKSMYSAIYIDAVLPKGESRTFTISARIAGETQPRQNHPPHQHQHSPAPTNPTPSGPDKTTSPADQVDNKEPASDQPDTAGDTSSPATTVEPDKTQSQQPESVGTDTSQ